MAKRNLLLSSGSAKTDLAFFHFVMPKIRLNVSASLVQISSGLILKGKKPAEYYKALILMISGWYF